jgi:hypothetical protein
MNDIERNKLGMYDSLIGFLQENRDITTTIRGFNWSLTKLRRVIDDIELKEKEISSQMLEKTIQTSKVREELIVNLSALLTSMFTYSRQIGDVHLKEKCRCTQSSLVRMRDSELIDKAIGTIQISEKHLDGLKSFKIYKKDIERIAKLVEQFKKSLEVKITSFISSDAVESMGTLFQDADRILTDQMDKYIELLDEQYDEFYDDYLLIRTMENQEEMVDSLEIEEIEE